MNLRLLGAPTLRDVVPAMVDASNIHNHSVAVPDDRLYQQNCTPTFPIVGTSIYSFAFCRRKYATCGFERAQNEVMSFTGRGHKTASECS